MGNTPKRLYLYEVDQGDYIVPYGFISSLQAFLTNNDIKHSIVDETQNRELKMIEKEKLSLYPWQEIVVDKVLLHNNGILVSPTGSGKTRMAMGIIGKRNVKTLWITNKLDLLRQSKNAFKTFFKNKAGQISGGKVNIQDVTFATVQTLNKLDLDHYKDTWDMIIVDEVHRAIGTPTMVSQFSRILNGLNAKYKYGLTATLFNRKNKISMSPIFLVGEKLYEVESKYIDRVTAKHVKVDLNTPESAEYLGDDKTVDFAKQTAHLVNNNNRNLNIAMKLIEERDNYNIILTNRLEHIDILSELLKSVGYESEILIGDTKADERERIIESFKNGEINFLFSNYQLASEGLDLPIANRLHMVLPVRDKRTTIQSAGRVERLHHKKIDAIVYDYVDVNIGNLVGMYHDRRRHLNAR